ncbi:hypothetical protein HNR39_003608 [Glaciimonas immobilis]|uniref:Uncharacterized protein n=1 Tax=Glaciimonas immobilis TaxID=728004 RepID=A0A840RZB4_9BURK|nr:hypothetical protein [Glaciimonas immobilis]
MRTIVWVFYKNVGFEIQFIPILLLLFINDVNNRL